MELDSRKLLNKLYEILSALQYNSERRELLEDVLKKFLLGKNPQIDIVSTARKSFLEKESLMKQILKDVGKDKPFFESEEFKQEWFKQEGLLLSNIPQQYIPEYIMAKFSPYKGQFEKVYNFDMSSLWIFAFKLVEYLDFKKMTTGFTDETYVFKNKKEYADLGFVKVPHEIFIEQWKNVITINKEELQRILFPSLSACDVENVLKILSINFDRKFCDPNDFRFKSRPLLQFGEELIVLTPSYLCRGLPFTYERLFKRHNDYLSSKGKSFEKMVQNVFKTTPSTMLIFNLRYGKKNKFEVDAIIGYEKSLWFIEASSHLPSSKALNGDLFHIRVDLNKTLKKCIIQGKRALRNLKSIPLPNQYHKLATKGIIVVVDGVYPNLNLEPFLNLSEDEKTPIYLINWFDLRTLLGQPELDDFEEFLLWRTQKSMPVVCFDEKDYWAFYFDRYKRLKSIREAFRLMKEKETELVYISYRFNKKGYLQTISRERTKTPTS